MRYDVEHIIEHGGKQVRLFGMLPGNAEEIQADRRHPAVILLAGGAYWRRSPREQEPVARKLLASGISPWILEYSVAPEVFPQSLCETLLAVGWLRKMAGEFRIDEGNISVCGFSAGGHLAASTGCFWDRDFIQRRIGNPGAAVRPDQLILCYPVITSGQYAHQDSIRCLLGADSEDEALRELVSLEKQVSDTFPPTFLWHTFADASVPVQNALLIALEIANHGVRLEMHVYPDGKHGLSTGDYESCGELKVGERYDAAEWVEKAVRFVYSRQEENKKD